MSNAYNFSDGLDGLAGGLLIIMSLGLIGMAFILNRQEGRSLVYAATAIPLGAVIGATLPFLALNRRPAKVFMGDVGSLPIGALFGLLTAGFLSYLTTHLEGLSSPTYIFSPVQRWIGFIAVLILSFVMIAELVPVPLQILSVKLRKGKRLFPRTPIHHAFELYGWPEAKITRMFFLVQAICSVLAIVIFWFAINGGKP
jgi:phospho-N-acetylmuramoyl-pentapeptide-transferase